MSELTRFRSARAPQRLIPDTQSLVPLERHPLSTGSRRTRAETGGFTAFVTRLLNTTEPQSVLAGFDFATVLTPTSPVILELSKLDRWLTQQANRPPVVEFVKQIKPSADLEPTPEWTTVRDNIAGALVATIIGKVDPSLRVLFTRWILLFGLVELYVDNPNALQTPAAIYAALRWRTPVLPSSLTAKLVRPLSALARRPGFADLYVTREEWNRYEAGEIAHIENILKGEQKGREYTRTTETEVTTTTATARTELNERDSQTTDRFELHQQSSQDTSLAAHIDGKVDTSGQYGPTRVDTHLGGSLDYSQDQSTAQATAQSRESIARAVTRVEEQVRQSRTERSLVRITEKDTHTLDNQQGTGPVVGVYRWVNKIQRVQMMKYPHRFLLEFEVPEPAAWLRWLHESDKTAGMLSKQPAPFTRDGQPNSPPVQANDISNDPNSPYYYLKLAAKYTASGLEPLPASKVVSINIKRDCPDDPGSDKEPIRVNADTTLTVPTGYYAVNWRATVLSWHNNRINNNDGVGIRLSVGAGDIQGVSAPKFASLEVGVAGVVGPISVGMIPVAIMTDAAYGYTINVEVTCSPSTATLTQWQLQSYDVLAAAYLAMQNKYDEERAARAVSQGIEITGSSPQRNAEVVREELKKQVIEMLTGTRFTGRPAVNFDTTGKPQTDLNKAVNVSAEIQFLEQAFEWENLSYILYPYYWADEPRWKTLAPIEGTDPDFARFLRCGSARVIIPARPGFEDQVNFYVWLGVIWGGGPVPAPADDQYLSIAQEIKSQQQGANDGVACDAWEVRLPTTLAWLENPVPLPVNPAPTITLPP